ncbi:MAG: Na+/H+ antiporter subunit C [Caldilineaceae bacterium]|nr:Na+/H+ antiporter subunit C [Caldilineaceae bacterium]
MAVQIGVLFACGAYLVLRRGEIKLILGLALLSHAVNLLIFSTGGWQRGLPPLLDKEEPLGALGAYVDPLPQALILTAIVISFAITAFVVVLVNRRFEVAMELPPTPPIVDSAGVFAQAPDYYEHGLDVTEDDYEWLEFASPDVEEEAHEPDIDVPEIGDVPKEPY